MQIKDRKKNEKVPSRGLGEGGVGSRPHPLPQSPPGDWEKGVWALEKD